MRKHQKLSYKFPIINHRVRTEQENIYKSNIMDYESNSLEVYHNQISRPRNLQIRKFSRQINDNGKQFSKVKNQLNKLRDQLKKKKTLSQLQNKKKMQRLQTQFNLHIHREMTQSIRPQPPIYYPLPLPIPIYIPQSNISNQFNPSETTVYSKKVFQRQNKKYKGISEEIRKNLMKKKWKKMIHVVLFIIYLRRFNQRIQYWRKEAFEQFIEIKLKKSLNQIKSAIIDSMKQFLNLLYVKKQVDYEIQNNEEKDLAKQKQNSIRKMIKSLLSILTNLWSQKNFRSKAAEPIYFLCKHGNYSCDYPLMTLEEFDLICISEKYGYVSAERNLQRSTIINLIIKLFVYNILLATSKIDPLMLEENIPTNIFLIASIFYELMIDVQDDYMIKVPKSYKIGNRGQNIKMLDSIVIGDAKNREGQLISGLMQQSWIKQKYEIQKWKEEKRKCQNLIDTIHQSIVSFQQNVKINFY